MSAHKEVEHAEHIEHISGSNKKIALLIAVIALFLAFSETLGKSAQTAALSDNVEASNLWAFFQAKTIRMTTLGTAADTRKIDLASVTDPAIKEAMTKQIDTWQKTAARYNDEPETNEGRKQLSARALAAEKKRDNALGEISPLRSGVGRLPDRDRARVRDRDHRHHGAELACDRPWVHRRRLHGDRAVRAPCGAFVLMRSAYAGTTPTYESRASRPPSRLP